MAPFSAGFGAVLLWFRAVHPGIARDKWQEVGRSMRGALSGGEDRKRATVLVPILVIWAYISTPSLKGVWHSQRRAGLVALRLAGKWAAAPSQGRYNGGASAVVPSTSHDILLSPKKFFHQNCTGRATWLSLYLRLNSHSSTAGGQATVWKETIYIHAYVYMHTICIYAHNFS